MDYLHPASRRRTTILACTLSLAASLAPPASAVCLPFGDAGLDRLERSGLRESGPIAPSVESAIARSRASGDHLQEAQLWAMVATRSIPLGDPQRFDDAVAAARNALDALDAPIRSSAGAIHVAQRLELDSASVAATPDARRAAIARVDALLAAPGLAGNVRACALIVRSLKHSDLGEQRAAAVDAMTAYRLAETGGFSFAHADAAIMLATAYRRAGLAGPATQLIAEAIARAPRAGPPGMLARARYVESQVHLDARRYDAALESLSVARDIWASLDNRFGPVAVGQMACAIAMERGDMSAAANACTLEPADLLRAGRPDMAVIQGAYKALLAAERGDTAEAARLIDTAVALLPNTPPHVESRLLRIRARVREAQRRWPEALADSHRSAELETIKREAERSHAAELLEAAIAAERTLQENRLLRVEADQAAGALRQEQTVRKLWAAAAGCALVSVALLVALLGMHRKRQARDRQAQAIVATLAANSPDALLLVGHDGHVRLSNRGLFGGAPPAPGLLLKDALPADACDKTMAALRGAMDGRELQCADVTIETEAGPRVFELKCAPIVVDGRVVGATLQSCDVTVTRRAERTAADVVTRERVRVAGALHEDLGQELTGVAMMLASLASQSRRGNHPDPDSLDAAAAALSRSVHRTRGLARDVAPVVVARRSLADALAALETSESGAMSFALDYDSALALPDSVSDQLFRLIRDIIDTGQRANVDVVRIQVGDASATEVQITVELGASREGATTPEMDHLDVAVLEHHVRNIGGSIQVQHLPEGGRRIGVRAPAAPAVLDGA